MSNKPKCSWCGIDIDPGDGRFCSSDCERRSNVRANQVKDGYEQLPITAELRVEIKCQVCGATNDPLTSLIYERATVYEKAVAPTLRLLLLCRVCGSDGVATYVLTQIDEGGL